MARAASLGLAAAGGAINLVFAVHLALLWNQRPESDKLGIDVDDDARFHTEALSTVWFLTILFFSLATLASVLGFIGIRNRIPSFVHLFRNYIIVDLVFCSFATILVSVASMQPDACSTLARHDELVRSLDDAGLIIEKCDTWMLRIVPVFSGTAVVLLVVRLYFSFALARYHKHGSFPTPLSSASSVPQEMYIISPMASESSDDLVLLGPLPFASLSHSGAYSDDRQFRSLCMADLPLRSFDAGRVRLSSDAEEGLLETYTF